MTEQNEFLALADQIEREGVKVYGVWHPEATVQSMIVTALRASGHGAGREVYICIDCDGRGIYPSGASCISCEGTGRVGRGDGPAALERTAGRYTALTKIAAECHRSKWQFDLSEDYKPSAAAARSLIKKSFDELHRIGDAVLKLRDAAPSPDDQPEKQA